MTIGNHLLHAAPPGLVLGDVFLIVQERDHKEGRASGMRSHVPPPWSWTTCPESDKASPLRPIGDRFFGASLVVNQAATR